LRAGTSLVAIEVARARGVSTRRSRVPELLALAILRARARRRAALEPPGVIAAWRARFLEVT
jgi:hypothetical protein